MASVKLERRDKSGKTMELHSTHFFGIAEKKTSRRLKCGAGKMERIREEVLQRQTN